MAEAEELFPLFTKCKLTVSDKITCKDGKLFNLLTDVLHFKILGVSPLIIEKESPSQQDICKLFDAVQEFQEAADHDQGATGKEVKNRVLVQVLGKTQVVEKELAEHSNENCSDDDGSIGKLSSQWESSTDNVSDLLVSFERLNVNDETICMSQGVTQIESHTEGSDKDINCDISDTDNAQQSNGGNNLHDLNTANEEKYENQTDADIQDQKVKSRNQTSKIQESCYMPDVTCCSRVLQIGVPSEECHQMEVVEQPSEKRLNAEEQVLQLTKDTKKQAQNKEKIKEDKEMTEVSTQKAEVIHAENSAGSTEITWTEIKEVRKKLKDENVLHQKDCEQVTGLGQPLSYERYSNQTVMHESNQLEKESKNAQTEERECETAHRQNQFMNNMNEGITRLKTADLNTTDMKMQTPDREEEKEHLEMGQAHSEARLYSQTKLASSKQMQKQANQDYENENQKDGQSKCSWELDRWLNSGVQINRECPYLHLNKAKQREDPSKKDDYVGDASCRHNREKGGSSPLCDNKSTVPQVTSTAGQQSESENSNIKIEEQKYNKRHEQGTKVAQTYEHKVNSGDKTPDFHHGEESASKSYNGKKLRDQTMNPRDSHDRMLPKSQIYKHSKNQTVEKLSKEMNRETNEQEHYEEIDDSKDDRQLQDQSQLHGSSTAKQVLEYSPRSEQNVKKNDTHNETVLQKPLHQHRHTRDEDVNSGSDEESQVICSMKKASFQVAKDYFSESVFASYFNKAVGEGTGYIFELNSNDREDVEFLYELRRLNFEEFDCMSEDIASVRSAVKAIKSELNGLKLHIKGNKVHLIGSKDVVASGRKKLASLLHIEDRKTQQLPKNMIRKDENTEVGPVLLKENKHVVKRQSDTRKIPSSEAGHEVSKSQPAVRPKTSQSSRSTTEQELGPISKHGQYYDRTSRASEYEAHCRNKKTCCFTTEICQLRVHVYKANITELEVDCIVNAANRRLQHLGGVARAISKAAGSTLEKECDHFIKAGNFVEVTRIFVSSGGDLPAIKVLHAVGPKWDFYQDKSSCLHDLRRTVLRCLVEASRLRMTSVALPSISAAIFKVPKEECARCYLEAVKHFDIFNSEGQGILKEIHFVDIDDTMINTVRERFMNDWSRPCDMDTVQKDCDFAKEHLRNASKPETANYDRSSNHENKPTDHSKPASSSARLSAGASAVGTTRQSYAVRKIVLHVDSKPALDLRSDITITLGKYFDKLSGLQDFKIKENIKRHDEMPSSKNTFEFFNVSKPGGKSSRLLCVVYPEPDNEDKIKEAFKNLEKALQKAYLPNLNALVLTSNTLYDEPSNKKQQKGYKSIDKKKIGKFAQCLYEYLNRVGEDTQRTTSVTVVGSETAVLTIQKVIESRDVKKIAPGAFPGPSQITRNITESRGQNNGSYQDSRGKSTNFSTEPQTGHVSGAYSGTNQITGSMNENLYRYSQGDHYNSKNTQNPGHFGEDVGTSVDSERVCSICFDNKPCWPVQCCKILLCQDCEKKMSICPYCRSFWKITTGDQPPATMTVTLIDDCADGYENFRAWKIEYEFPPGVQQRWHPSPGKMYNPIRRTAYLPANDVGFHVLMLLRLAFIRKLIFTIGRSLTSNKEDSITWNDIHHKTSLHGGMYGYPDANYINRVIPELANKGVKLDTLTESEETFLDHFRRSLTIFGHFHDIFAL